ncbi:hypothetical protein CRG98_018661 [Punica granatum]|uniref:Uncharacterized protein n=1 Tax=Punica granatum TaxID=22663 RepID=A0A2I0JXD8_PUNGR|nr:hypothetical protein CRG98_018661 [Punica granatum]
MKFGLNVVLSQPKAVSCDPEAVSLETDPTQSIFLDVSICHFFYRITSPLLAQNILPAAAISIGTIIAPNILNLVHIQLKESNYMVWKTLFSTFLKSHDLLGLMDGSRPCPPITDPLFASWSRTYDNIRSWLFSPLSEQILEEVHDLPTAQQIWEGLHSWFVECSHSRALDSKVELTRIKLEDFKNVESYLHHCEQLANQLKEIGRAIDDEDLITYALVGLAPQYESFITSLINDRDPLSFGALHNKLMLHENRLRQIYLVAPAPATTALQITTQSGGRGGGGRGTQMGSGRGNGCLNRRGGRGGGRYNNNGTGRGYHQQQGALGHSPRRENAGRRYGNNCGSHGRIVWSWATIHLTIFGKVL